MNITNVGANSPSVPFQAPLEAPSAAGSEPATASAPAASNSYTPSPELQRLVSLARAEPEVRTDRVQSALARLQSGDYHAPATFAKTADAILAGAD